MTQTQNFIHYFIVIFFPYLLTMGTVSNIICVVLLRRYSFNVWSTCFYLTILFSMDIINLYVACGNKWFVEVHEDRMNLGHYILCLSNAVCKVYSFTFNLLTHEYSWAMVAVGIEMVIATRNPKSIYKMCTRERATAVILFISVLLISLNLHYFWTFGLVRPEDEPNIQVMGCTYINELSNQFRDYIWPNIDLFVGQVIPLVVLVSFIVITLYKLITTETDMEENKRLQKYFLDLKTLMELRTAVVYYTFINALTLLCGILSKGWLHINITGLVDVSNDNFRIGMSVLETTEYCFMSHKFWIFYAVCHRFRSDTKALAKSLCRPFTRKYRKSHTKTCTLLNKEQDYERSWQAGQFTMTENVETI